MFADHFGRYTHGNAIGLHIPNNYRVGPDIDIVADGNLPKNLGPGADVDMVANAWSYGIGYVLEPYGHTVANNAMVTEPCIATDDNVSKMIYAEMFPHLSLAREFNSS